MGESLLTPGLQTFVRVQTDMNLIPTKNLDEFKGKAIKIRMQREILKDFGFEKEMRVNQTIYRLSERHLFGPNIEEFVLHACDPSLLEDAAPRWLASHGLVIHQVL